MIGGSNGHSDELSCGETYDPHADEWTQVPELRTNRCNAGQTDVQELLIEYETKRTLGLGAGEVNSRYLF